MDNKNVFVAIALSMSVLLFWGAFFETPRQEQKLSNNTKVEKSDQVSNIAPNLNPEIIFYTIDGDKVENFFHQLQSSEIKLNTITLKKLNDNELFVDIKDSQTVFQQIEYFC